MDKDIPTLNMFKETTKTYLIYRSNEFYIFRRMSGSHKGYVFRDDECI